MSRNKKKAVRQRTVLEARKALKESLNTLCLLNDAYDKGSYGEVRTIALLLSRILQEELKAIGERRKIRMVSYAKKIEKNGLAAQTLLAIHEISNDGSNAPPKITYLPTSSSDSYIKQSKHLPFFEWQKAPVYIQGVDTKGRIKLNQTNDFKNRWRISRIEAILAFRNQLGGHFDTSVSPAVENLQTWTETWAVGHIGSNGEELNTIDNPSEMPTENSQSDATLRCISAEVVASLSMFAGVSS